MSFLDYFKDAWELAKKVQSVELQKELLDMREEFNAVAEENVSLREQLRALRDQAQAEQALEFRDNAYFRRRADGMEGPFCQRCWDVDRRLVRMQVTQFENGGILRNCEQCTLERNRRR